MKVDGLVIFLNFPWKFHLDRKSIAIYLNLKFCGSHFRDVIYSKIYYDKLFNFINALLSFLTK